MTINLKRRFAPQPKVLLVAAIAVLAFAEGVSAFATGGALKAGESGSCLFSLELQSSYEVRRTYMIGLERTTGKGATGGRQAFAMWQEGSIGNDSYGSALSQGGAGGSPWLDEFSTSCLSCHDGVEATAIGVNLRDRPFDRRPTVTSSTSEHPLGMIYSRYLATGRGYKELLDANVVLVNGKVGCLSCHDPLNPAKGHLVKTDRSTSVCHSCHDK